MFLLATSPLVATYVRVDNMGSCYLYYSLLEHHLLCGIANLLPTEYNVSMSGNRNAIRRSSKQIARDRSLISELMLQGYRTQQIQEVMAEKVGYELSITQVSSDKAAIKRSWLENTDINYGALVLQERNRIDALEQKLWDQFYESSEPKIRQTIEKFAKDGVIDEATASKLIETRDFKGADIRWMELIHKVQQERRKLWGLYAPETKQIKNEIIIKGYKTVSPSDWTDDDDVVEGEVEETKQLGAGDGDSV